MVQYSLIKTSGWGAWIRTMEWGLQRPLPYHLATPQYWNKRSKNGLPAEAPQSEGGTPQRAQRVREKWTNAKIPFTALPLAK